MKTRATVVLAAVAVVVLALGVYFGLGNQDQETELPAAQLAFPGLAPKLADAKTIEIAQTGKTLHLARSGDAWTLPDKGGYPAQASRVHELLTGLAELKLLEPRTSNAAEYARLGVQDPPKQAPKDAKAAEGEDGATLMRVLGGGGAPIAQLLVGKTHAGTGNSSGDGVYVRRPGEAQAWLAEGHLSTETDPTDWIDKDIADIPADKIATVTVTRGGQTLNFSRKDGKLELQSPADHPKLDQFKLDDVGRALASLTLDDVKPLPAPGTEEGQAVFTTSDGMTVTATVNKDGSDIWASFAATPPAAGADKDKDKEKEKKAKEAAEALAAKVKGWAYKLGSWKEAALVPTLDDLKAYVPPPPAAKPGAPAAAVPPAPAPAVPAAAVPAPAVPAPAAPAAAAPAAAAPAAAAPAPAQK